MYNFSAFQTQVSKATQHFRAEMNKLRTGGASIQLLDPVRVEAYGTVMNLNEVASISVADPTLLIVKPYDKSQLENVAKGIQNAQLNLSPIVDGDQIKVPVPSLTTERRQEMVKVLHGKLEEARVILRSIRADAKGEIEAQENEAGVSEDNVKADLGQLEKEFQAAIEQLEKLVTDKEVQLLEI